MSDMDVTASVDGSSVIISVSSSPVTAGALTIPTNEINQLITRLRAAAHECKELIEEGGEIRTLESHPAPRCNTFPTGYSSRLAPSWARTSARPSPSCDQSADITFRSTKRGVPPFMGTRSSVPPVIGVVPPDRFRASSPRRETANSLYPSSPNAQDSELTPLFE